MASNGYYALWSKPDEMTTDTAATFKLSTVDTMTGVTYSVKYEFTCDGVTTSQTIATGLTATTYTYTPRTATFGPLMTKSEQGTIKMAFETNNGRGMTYYATIPLKLKASIKPSRSNSVTSKTNHFNSRSISNITTHKYMFKVAGLYGASQTVNVTIGNSKYTKEVAAVSDNTSTSVSFDIGALEATGSSDYDRKTINIKITDSRGRTYTSSDYIDIYKYSPPDVLATVDRNADEKPVLTFTPSYQATVAGATNSLTIFWARCNVDGEAYETDLKGKTSPQVLVGTYDLSKAYQFTIVIKDSVRQSAIIKRVILPSAIPVMDIGADGKTVTFFGTSPNSADKNTLRVGDVASFGEEVVLGDTSNSYTVVKATGLTVHDKNTVVGDDTDVIASIGIGNAVNAAGSKVTGPFYTLGVRSFNEVDGVGIQPTENGLYSMAEGWLCEASGYASHAEGNACSASGHLSHAGGMNSGASGFASFAHGYNLSAKGENQAVFGMNNIVDANNKYLLIVGNGPGDGSLSNAFGVTASGHIDVQKNIYINTNGSGIFERDTDGTNRELIAMDGNNNLSIGYGQYSHGGRETVLQGGNKLTFRLKNPNATWRPYMSKGYSFNTIIQVGGYITNSGKDVTFQLPLNNPVIGNPTVTIASVDGLCVRQNNKYLYGSAASTFAKPSSYSCTLLNGGNHIKITAKMANTTNVENNSACGIYASIKVTFS